MKIIRSSSLIYYLSLAAVCGGGVGLITYLAGGPGLITGAVVAAILLAWNFRKPLRRWRVSQKPLPESYLIWLRKHIPFYTALDDEGQEHFERDVKFVLNEQSFEGVGGVKVTDELKLSVAAGLALMLYGRPDWEISGGRSILFYPNRFDDDYFDSSGADYSGMAHQQGPVILAAQAVKDSWRYPFDGNNVVLHELAHLFDFMNTEADGVPALIDPSSADAWQDLVRREMKRIRDGRSLLDSYGSTAPSEFFAVAVETFFERPIQMKGQHSELFDAMKELFNLDPRLPWQNEDVESPTIENQRERLT